MTDNGHPSDEVDVGDEVLLETEEITIVAEVETLTPLPWADCHAVWLNRTDAAGTDERYFVDEYGELRLYEDAVGTAAEYGPVEELTVVED